MENKILTPEEWKELRDKFFNECTENYEPGSSNVRKVHLTPHSLFEWFKTNINQLTEGESEEKYCNCKDSMKNVMSLTKCFQCGRIVNI